MGKRAFLILVAATCGWAQPAPAPARVSGVVRNHAGEPLAHATVALVGNNATPGAPLAPGYEATSGSDGAFAFENVEVNSYRLFVQRRGYLEFIYEEPDLKVSFPIASGQQKTVEVRMTAPSFLSGRVTDEEGEPFPDARVTIYSARRVNGKRTLQMAQGITAGKDGDFSSGGLPEGRYYLAAAPPAGLTQTNQREIHAGKKGTERDVQTFYPSVLDAASATMVDLPAETEQRNLDIRMRRTRVFHLYGRIVNGSGAVVRNGQVSLRDVTFSGLVGNRIPVMQGSFAANGLLPGMYMLQVSTFNPNQQAHQLITIADSDLEDVTVTVAPALDIPLSVRIEDADPQQENAIRSKLGRFSLTSADGFNTNAMAAQARGEGWVFRNIGPGTYRMGLGGPDGTYVKSIRYGDQDVTLSELDTTATASTLEMVLSPHAAEASGVIKDAMGKPLPGIAVTLWPSGLPPGGPIEPMRSTFTDGNGHFEFGSLRPGEYCVAAWETRDLGLVMTPEFHARFDKDAAVVKLSEDSRITVEPPLIGHDAIEAEAAKLP